MENIKKKMPVIYGMPWFRGVTQEMIDTFPKLSARQDDIYVSTYPKAGTTWTQEIVWQIINNGKIDYRRLDVRMPWIDGMLSRLSSSPYQARSPEMIQNLFESFPSPRVFKTHLPYDLVPKPHNQDTKPRYIYIMRNPKDTAVSWYYHYLNMPFEPKPSWNEFFESFCKGEADVRNVFSPSPLGVKKLPHPADSWFDHVLSWWKHKDSPSMLCLKYEEMKKDLPSTIKKIAKFIGKELSEEIVQVIADQASFTTMKKGGHVNYTWAGKLKIDFIRKGQVGDWKNYFTDEQSDRLDALYAEKMAGSGLVFDYGEKLAAKL